MFLYEVKSQFVTHVICLFGWRTNTRQTQHLPPAEHTYNKYKTVGMFRSDLWDRDRADLGIFPLIGIGNFERGPKPDFLFIYLFIFMSEHNLWQNADAHVTFRLDLN